MFIHEQDTQPLPVIPLSHDQHETQQERYRRLKAFSDVTGIRFLFVYRFDEQLRLRKHRAGVSQDNHVEGR